MVHLSTLQIWYIARSVKELASETILSQLAQKMEQSGGPLVIVVNNHLLYGVLSFCRVTAGKTVKLWGNSNTMFTSAVGSIFQANIQPTKTVGKNVIGLASLRRASILALSWTETVQKSWRLVFHRPQLFVGVVF